MGFEKGEDYQKRALARSAPIAAMRILSIGAQRAVWRGGRSFEKSRDEVGLWVN
jgi:hypothetical protein